MHDLPIGMGVSAFVQRAVSSLFTFEVLCLPLEWIKRLEAEGRWVHSCLTLCMARCKSKQRKRAPDSDFVPIACQLAVTSNL